MAHEHFHVVSFINGCLNDYDSGPIETLEDARSHLDWHIGFTEGEWFPAGDDRYENGIYILKVETCTEDCDPNADY